MKKKHLRQAVSFILVFLLMCSFAITYQESIFGHSICNQVSNASPKQHTNNEQTIINTTEIAPEVNGYAGPTPVNIYINADQTIDSIVPLHNTETPDFFNRLSDEGLLEAWDGKTINEAIALKVDAVSGATFSSISIIKNVQAGLHEYNKTTPGQPADSTDISWPIICAFAVALSAAILPLIIRNKTYRLIQQLLNVGILGFWTGTFIDYAMIIHVFANSIILNVAGILSIILLIIGFIFPLFGKHHHYCSHVCPLGSAQDLMGRINKKKLPLPQKLIKVLNIIRNILWVILTIMLWAGIGTEWIDHELFTAFIVKSASKTMLIIGGAILIISIIIPRPFCRFICPTGTLMKQSEKIGI
ncbi:MAG: 4Fe-4S binding protein [Clostridium sp.]|nr:4Fe-4S binding protein [Prevotella sp.]MCM1429540.1 4Fe-4S binding protein [Clostridium sp.]MCM1476052.1 4Fe-4S binding protein [Muribaculaceae bacterium]